MLVLTHSYSSKVVQCLSCVEGLLRLQNQGMSLVVAGMGLKPIRTHFQRWSRGHKARGQGQGHKKNPRPRPRTRTAFPRTDTLEAKDRNARGQGQGPRTQSASALQKKKKKVFTKIFQAISTKKRFPKNFSSATQNFNIPKNRAVLDPRTGQFSRT